MSTLNEQLYIDGVVVYGTSRRFLVSIQQPTEETQASSNPVFESMDLSPYNIRFRILGSARGNGTVLVEKIISQISDEDTEGIIEEPSSGQFTFVVTAEDTKTLNLGSFPIIIELLDVNTNEPVYTLTEGGIAQGEFNKISIVRV